MNRWEGNMIVSLAVAMGLMLSPASLVLLGNSMGRVGLSYLIIILFAMGLQLFTAFSFGELINRYPSPGGEAKGIQETLGTIPATVLPLCSRVVFTICIGTILLSKAGYAFNEVFAPWFPNLGFSFCLLGFLLVLNLLGPRIAETAQVFFAGLTALGLVSLSFAGLLESGTRPLRIEGSGLSGLPIIPDIFLSLLLFTGFDLAGLRKSGEEKGSSHFTMAMVLGIILSGSVLLLWGFTSYQNVPPDRLSETTVPYMVAAREILGQQGRIVMGMLIMTATCGAVNSLLMAGCGMIAGMAALRLLPSYSRIFPPRFPMPLILLATGIGVMMATGMAGEPALEVYGRGGFLFWLLTYAVDHLVVLMMRSRVPGYPVVPVISCLFLLAGFLGLIRTEDQSDLLLKFMFFIFIIVSFLSLLWSIYSSRRKEVRR